MNNLVIPSEEIQKNIYTVRGLEVMLDSDIARIYEVETKRINEAVKNNPRKFPADLMFELTAEEEEQILRSKISTSRWGGKRYASKVFTEQGIYMLATILKSDKAIDITLSIMRTFTKLRQYAMEHKDLALQMHALKQELKQELTQEITKTKSWTKDRLNAVADSIIILEESITELQDVFTDFKSANEVEKIGFTRKRLE